MLEHVLERADPPADCVPNDPRGDCQPIDESNKDYWYLPPPGQPVHEMQYKIPSTLSCEKCTLQWRWYTANSCSPDPQANACYFKKLQNLGWDSSKWCGAYCGTCNAALLATNMSQARKSSAPLNCGEQFRNCADLKILPSGRHRRPRQHRRRRHRHLLHQRQHLQQHQHLQRRSKALACRIQIAAKTHGVPMKLMSVGAQCTRQANVRRRNA